MKVRDYTFKAQWGAPDNPARVVKPRKNHTVNMRIVTCDANLNVWYEDKTDMRNDWDLIDFVRYIRANWPRDAAGKRRNTPIMLICHNPHRVFQRVHDVFKDDPEWNTKFSVTEPDKFHRDGEIRAPKLRNVKDIRISLFGFRDDKRQTKYFHTICPLDFMDDFRGYGDPDWPEYIRLYKWGGTVRQWVRKHKLRMSPTRGGLSAQLLRDRKFYPDARRKVPKVTNENARPAMPGNFYAMREESMDRMYAGVFVIDQQNAHHYAAETVDLPNANDLFAYGRFATQSDKPFARENRVTYENLVGEYGLFRCRIWVPKGLFGMLPPWAQNHGLHNAYLYSNELELAKSLGVEIRYISYAYTSREVDEGLRKYAQWAQRQVKEYPEHKQWLKPTLLSGYGILGARPRHIEVAHFRSDKGESHRYLLGPYPVIMKRMKTKRKIQPVVSNTVQRGMIEAETRRLSIELARRMELEGHTVIAIHADGLLVKDEGQQLPLLPPPWRVKDRLTGFEAIDDVSYRSDTVCILPGRKKASTHRQKVKTK
jgi:hypothetical protein